MTVHVRPARLDDLDAVGAFTRDTFPWGDYVAERLPEWLGDETSAVLVATDEQDEAIGIARVAMLSANEAWLHAARVHPEHRRKGIGSLLNHSGVDWAREQGAVVVRLLIEDWNDAARKQVAAIGYRPVAPWAAAWRTVAGGEIDPRTNGGRRVPGEERLNPGSSAETEPSWIAWSTGQLAATGRQLFPLGWHFRRMTTDDVVGAARRRALWHCPSGWVIADREEGEDRLVVSWVVTSDLDAERLIRALLDRAEATGVEEIRVMVPRVPWMVEVLEAEGFEVELSTVFARSLV